MASKPLTDSESSLYAPEFVWDVDGSTESQELLFDPISRVLRANGCRTLLDLGCGNGAFSALLRKEGFEVNGCDGSRSGIQLAAQNNQTGEFWQQDFNSPLPAAHVGRYDAVVSTEVIEHLLLPRSLIRIALSALRPGGLLVLSAPYHGYLKNLAIALAGKFDDHWHPLRDFGHVKFFSRRTLSQLLEECGVVGLQFSTVGRIPLLARSMIFNGRKPS